MEYNSMKEQSNSYKKKSYHTVHVLFTSVASLDCTIYILLWN